MTSESGLRNPTFEQLLKTETAHIANVHEIIVRADRGCESLLDNGAFEYLLRELVDNCAEKDHLSADLDIYVDMRFNPLIDLYTLRVGDNVSYTQSELQVILNNLEKHHSQRIGKKGRESGGGFGKISVQNILSRWGGELTYHATPQNSILAVATWQRRFFLNPLPNTKVALPKEFI